MHTDAQPPLPKLRRLQCEHTQPYRNRTACYDMLDDRHFDHLNQLDHSEACGVLMTLAGCLDAMDEIPAGSILATADSSRFRHGMYAQRLVTRGLTREEMDEIDRGSNDLIDWILSEPKEA